MAVKYEIESRCECQATLGVELDEEYLVLQGWAKRHGPRETAPASSVGNGDRFDLSWHCPMCGRNTLRTVYRGALQTVPSADLERHGSSNEPAATEA